nr:prostasin-like [Lytechinus pictus]
MRELVCSAYFPECIHNGPTRRPCLSECLDVTNACEPLYEEMVGQPWPINCTHFTDSQPDNEGSCLGGRGDYFNTTVCGTRPAYTQDQSRVVGGANAKEGEFPWMVYLYDYEYGQVCGGTLIAPEWIVTAAHCVVDIPYTVDHIILGDLLLSSPSNHHLNLSLAEIIVYPEYNRVTYDGDVALIRLSHPVSFTDYLRPACLAESAEEVQDYKRCTVSGWGDTESDFIADVLQKAVVGLIPQETCARLYPNETTDLMMCAGYERGGIDTCQGDSGGPLVCEGEDGRWHLVGVTSWGNGCADPGYPGIYARVSRFISFITETVNPHSSDVIIVAVDDEKQISSPNWPSDYESNTDLTWHVIAPPDHSIVITFISFNLESTYDNLVIHQGVTGNFDQSYQSHFLTGNQLPDPITTFTSYAWLQFTSDGSVAREGFSLTLSITEMRGWSWAFFTKS